MNRDVFPPLRDLPYVIAAYALTAFIGWAVLRHEKYRELVLSIVTRASFWQVVCAGLVLFLIAALIEFYRTYKEPLT
jgi:hypothetical protein